MPQDTGPKATVVPSITNHFLGGTDVKVTDGGVSATAHSCKSGPEGKAEATRHAAEQVSALKKARD
jgi:hypothetical protein